MTRARDNKQFTFREQDGFIDLGDERRKVRVSLADDQAAYAPGVYEILDTSFGVSRFGDLEVSRLALKPITASVSVPSVAARQAG
jgi:hypothetical protein